MHLTPYLHFKNQCGDAFRFYEKALGGKNLMIMTYGDAPGAEKMPEEMKSQVIHARLAVGDTMLMGSDTPPDRFHQPQGFSVSVQTKSPEEAHRAFEALAQGGHITMPIAKSFFSPAFGMLTDKFGIPWMVNCEQAG